MDEEIEEITEHELKQLVKLIKAHNKVLNLYTAEEYLENLLEKDEIVYSSYVLKAFLKFNRHEQIFTCLSENFCILHKIKLDEKLNVRILLNLLIFETNEESYDSILSYFVVLKPSLIKNLLDYVTNEEFMILLTEVTCRRFHSEYTLEKVIEPLVINMEYLNKIKQYIFKCYAKKIPQPKSVTIPISPRAGLSKTPVVAAPPKEESMCRQPFVSKKTPKTTYQKDEVILRKLQKARDKNQKEALALLDIARKRAFSCAQIKDKTETTISRPEEEPEIFKAQKLPKFKKVEVKPNALTLMREAALMVKKCEAEVKKIDNLTNTQFNFSLYEQLEEKERKKMQLEQMQDIKKKHLQGLLTYEEAILAKQNVIKINQEKMEEFKEEKIELYKKLEEWREEEQKKIKILVEKSQQIEQRARDAQNEIIEDRHRFVKMIQQEKKERLEKAMEEKERELNRKIELIKDLRALQSLRNLNHKEFDPTETSNLGLMCEMSIAELQERLFLLKIEVEEELKNKKKLINETRKQRQELVEQAQQFIAQNRQLKEKSKKSEQLMMEDTEEILALRKRIDDARKLRLQKEII